MSSLSVTFRAITWWPSSKLCPRGNKSGRKAFEDFVRKAAEFLEPPGPPADPRPPAADAARSPGHPRGVWDEVAGVEYLRPADKTLTLAAYESGAGVRAFIEPVAVGDTLIDMPLFLEPGRHVEVPLEETYHTAFEDVPRRWRTILEGGL